MTSRSNYPYLDPDWIPLIKAWIQPSQYDPNKTSDQLARDLAYISGKMDILARLEAVVRTQENANG